MIVVDTSALIAIIADEPQALRCFATLRANEVRLISAGTMVEALIVGARIGLQQSVANLVEGYGCEVVPVTSQTATTIGSVYRKWGKNFHKAKLNFGDCFAYALAKEYDCPLLYVGNDFAQTDIKSAL